MHGETHDLTQCQICVDMRGRAPLPKLIDLTAQILYPVTLEDVRAIYIYRRRVKRNGWRVRTSI